MFNIEKKALRSWGQRGVVGPFAALFGEGGRFENEVASVYAELFHRLGYLPGIVSTERDWPAFVSGMRDRFEGVDCRRSDIEAELGRPSFVSGNMVWCYAPVGPLDGWVFFDFAKEPGLQYQPGLGSYRDLEANSDPLLRDIRVPGPDFEASLVLTLYGKVCRWGTGWWTMAKHDGGSDAPPGVAGQLNEIAEADPSQALRRPPPAGYRPE